jgi:multiple sugar transport system permease protein
LRAAGLSDGRLKLGFVGPTLAFLILFNLFPLLYNVVLSFTDAELVGASSEWVGGRNYARVFSEERFGRAVRTTGLFVGSAVAIQLVLGFVIALALARPFRGKVVLLTLLLVPMMLPQAVMGLFWNLVLSADYGILNQSLAALGLPEPQWLTDTSLRLVSIVLIDVWMWTPFMMLISLAGLNAIPPYVYEAAEIDRASSWTVFWRITLPMTAPLLGLAVLLRVTDALKQFDLVMAITGPNDAATQTVSALLYQVVFLDGRVGLGAAYACVVLVIVIALATIFLRYLERLQGRRGALA